MSEPVRSSAPSWLYEREEPDTRTPLWRTIVGWLFFALAVLVFAIYVWAAFDTRHYVVLASRFGSMPTGVFLLLLLLTIAFILAKPINTASERRRSQARATLIILTVITLLAALVVYAIGLFRYQPSIVANSPSGARHAAYVKNSGNNTLRVFAGSGLGQREVGNVGVICGREAVDRVSFDGENTLKVSTPYNDFVIRLDPSTGAPLNHFGMRCDDPAQ